ncbi:MAG: InlB B-repeat-containing protein, partial [Clostridiales bacterium]|nr:InlB B-repeat-containing protein [Clostridiales bacterium]
TGWNTLPTPTEEDSGTVSETYTSSATSEADALTLYAQWEEVTDETTYTLTYSFEDATLTIDGIEHKGSYEVPDLAAGTDVTVISAPEKDGYTFKVWKNEAAGTEYEPGDTITVNGDITLTADFVLDTNDKIGLSVFTAIGEFDTRVNETGQYFITTKIDGTNYTYAQTGDLNVTADKSAWNVGDEDAGETREVTVTIDAAVNADSLEIIARVAASMARDMVSGTAVSSLTAADLRSVVTEVVGQLKDATGLNLSLDVNNIVSSLRGEGKTFWDNTEIGNYVSGMTVTIPVPTIMSSYTAELEFTVDDGAVTLVKTDDETLRTAAIACAKAIAVQLYDSLQGSLHGTTLSDKTDNFALSAEVDIAFTPNGEYAETVAPYATDYKLTVTTSFNSNGTILFAYNNDTIDVALNMTNADIASKYENGYALALGSAAVKNRIASMVESMITSDSSESNVLSTINDILVEATSGSSSEESSAVSSAVTDAVTEWVVTNATNGSTETDNSTIYSLVDTLAETTIGSETVDSEYISNALTSSNVSEDDAAVIVAYVEAYQEKVAETGTLTADEIADIKASVTDPTTGDDVDAVIDRLIEDYLNGKIEIALSVVEDSDADSWTALIAAAEAESGSTNVSMNDILTLLSDLGTVDGLQNCTVESLGNLLQSGLLDNYSGMVTTALNSISNINITTPASLNNAITIKIKANGSNHEIPIDSGTLEEIIESGNGIYKLGELLIEFGSDVTVEDLYLQLYVDYASVSMYIDFSLYFG